MGRHLSRLVTTYAMRGSFPHIHPFLEKDALPDRSGKGDEEAVLKRHATDGKAVRPRGR